MNLALSREETSAMKGYAILCIVLHNLLHLVGPLVKENEFYYNYNYRAYWMWEHLKEMHPNIIGDVLSFFGWYGVPVFIFLSGYGITMKYEPEFVRKGFHHRWDGFWEFFRYNFKKLWLLMAPAFLLFLLLGVTCWDKHFTGTAICAQLTMTINFLCSPKEIDPGVYWYFGLTLQLYLVYRILLYRLPKVAYYCVALGLIAISTYWLIWQLPDPMLRVQPDYEYLSHNCIRWLMPFIMGCIWGRITLDTPSNAQHLQPVMVLFLGLCSLGLLVYFSFGQVRWLFTPVLAILVSITYVRLVSQVKLLMRIGLWLGGLSAYIFAIHPLVRPFFTDLIVPQKQLLMTAQSWLWVGVYLIIVLIAAIAYRFISRKYVAPLCEIIINACAKSMTFKKK